MDAKELYEKIDEYMDKEVTLEGWIRNHRKQKEFGFIATVVNSNKNFSDYKPKGKLVVMFGSEADGLCNELLNLADEKLTIKMANNVESLNLALCAGIVLYKLQE